MEEDCTGRISEEAGNFEELPFVYKILELYLFIFSDLRFRGLLKLGSDLGRQVGE